MVWVLEDGARQGVERHEVSDLLFIFHHVRVNHAWSGQQEVGDFILSEVDTQLEFLVVFVDHLVDSFHVFLFHFTHARDLWFVG